jgi:hypothetical protein
MHLARCFGKHAHLHKIEGGPEIENLQKISRMIAVSQQRRCFEAETCSHFGALSVLLCVEGVHLRTVQSTSGQ